MVTDGCKSHLLFYGRYRNVLDRGSVETGVLEDDKEGGVTEMSRCYRRCYKKIVRSG